MNYYDEIKKELLNNEVYKKAKDYSKNRSDLMTYYNVGRLIVEAQGGEKKAKYGDKLIEKYSNKLMIELDKKYSYRNIFYMRKFYLIFKCEKVNAMRSKLSWTHYRILLRLDNIEKIKYYIDLIDNQILSTRELENRIKSKEYERLDEETKNKVKRKERGNKIRSTRLYKASSSNKK